MEIYRDLAALPVPALEPVATLGNFDGVHRGHQAILARVQQEAERLDAPTMVITFDPHPRTLLRPDAPHHAIMSLEARLQRLEDLGVDHTLVLEFDHDMAEMPAREFIQTVLWDALHMRAMYVGPYTSFGHARGGDVRLLGSEGRRLGYDIGVVDPVSINGVRVSSTRVRESILAGDMGTVARLLGRHHQVRGTVVEGDKRGRTIGFPTANLETDGGLLPPNGVYAAWVLRDGQQRHGAVVNIGVRPTFGEDGPVTVEAHLLDFDGDLYGQQLTLSIVQSLRGEMRFEGVEALKLQITEDARGATRVLGLTR